MAQAADLRERASFKLKLFAGLATTGLNALIYHVANQFPFGQPRLLPWTAVDAYVPFLPNSVWLYFSDYVLVASAFLLCRTVEDVRRFARAFVVMLFVGCAVHVLWPTMFPRQNYPLDGDGITALAFVALRKLDAPTSCLPSMHVAGSFLAAFFLWRNPRWQFWTWLFWAFVVAVSTLTTKQHYAVDVVTGIALALVTWILFSAKARMSSAGEDVAVLGGGDGDQRLRPRFQIHPP